MNKIFKIILIVMLVITVGLVAAAAATGGSNEIINLNIIWGYVLAGLAVAAALFCAAFGLVSAPAGIKTTLLSVGLVAVIIGVSYAIASGHEIKIFNLGDGGYFGAEETIITETSIYVTYVAGAAVVLAALAGEVMGFIEGLKK